MILLSICKLFNFKKNLQFFHPSKGFQQTRNRKSLNCNCKSNHRDCWKSLCSMFKGFEQLNCSITRVSNDKEIQPKSDPCIRELDGLKMGSGHHYCHVTEKRVEKLERRNKENACCFTFSRIYRVVTRGKRGVMISDTRSEVLTANFKQASRTVHDWRRKFALSGNLLLRIFLGLCYITGTNCDWKERMPRGTNNNNMQITSRLSQLGYCDLEETCDWSWNDKFQENFKKSLPLRNKLGPNVDASNSTEGKIRD